MKIYIASSWRNRNQPAVVECIRAKGHEVYDFRHPPGGDGLDSWRKVDPNWERWTPEEFRAALKTPIAKASLSSDFDAMKWAEALVLVLPCGKSAHLELGWAIGQKKKTVVLLDHASEPELMYGLVEHLCVTLDEVLETLKR